MESIRLSTSLGKYLSLYKGNGRLYAIFFLVAALCGCKFPGIGSKASEAEMEAAKNPCIVLALPASGPYAPFANKIKKGASIAKSELQAEGVNLRIEHVNTQAGDWIKALDALPPVCAVVGGPLREKAYMTARNSGALEKRVFFSFMPALQKGDEGKQAWRFFPSQQDQIDALVKFAADDLDINSFGSFYPSDSYGPRMTAMLEKKLASRHLPLQKASYNPSSPASWSAAVEPLIQPTTLPGSKTPIPQTKFEAIFLPDSWKHMDMLTTSMMYNGEDRLVLMGTTLWEAGLAGKQVPKAGRYSLAVFPGAWNASKAPKKLQTKGNDFWVALGYDFINFAVNTGIVGRLESGSITARAQRGSNVVRGMAPINWDNSGIAHQNLYLFQVGPEGMRPMNLENFKAARASVRDQAALRIQGLPSVSDDGSVKETVASPVNSSYDTSNDPGPIYSPVSQPAQPVTEPQITEPAAKPAPRPTLPPNQILSPVPQPSYKLRLPNK